MHKTSSLIAGVLALTLVSGGAAQAAFFNYDINGTASGTLGGVSFTDAAFSISIVGDVDEYEYSAGWEEYNPVESLVFDIAGFSPAQLTIGATLGRNYNAGGNTAYIYAGRPNSAVIMYMSIDPAFEMLSEFFLTLGTGLAAFTDVPTAEGMLSFTEVSSVTFSSALVSDVPLPAPAALLLAGLGGLALVRRRAA